MQRELLEQGLAHARDYGPGVLPDWSDQGPPAVADTPAYRSGTGPAVDHVIELALLELRATTPGTAALPYAFEVSSRGRLIRVSDNVVVDTFRTTTRTRALTVDQWTADAARLAGAELRDALRRTAANYIDQWALLFYPEPGAVRAENHDGPVPDYVLRPVNPPVRQSVRLFARIRFINNMDPEIVATTSPTLSWEPLPRVLGATSGSGTAVQNLRYDVLLFSPAPGTPGAIVAGAEVASYPGLTATSVRIEPALKPCTYYFWTVRARFDLDGRKRMTEWSGAYWGSLGDIDPRWARREEWPGLAARWPNRFVYFPFRTPAAEGSDCT